MTARLVSISIYPLKSAAGRSVEQNLVESLGLAGDRRWMVVGADGECITARRDRALLRIDAIVTSDGIRLSADGRPPHEVMSPNTSGPTVEVSVHGRPLRGTPADPRSNAWVGEVIGRDDVRLIHLAEPRPLNPAHSLPGDATAFADAYPITLASMASLRRLQDWVTATALERGEQPADIPMQRFRPNLVIDGALDAFAEDGWAQVCVGDVRLDVAKCIDRCVLTTIDPHTLDAGHEPIRSLARHHAWDGATWFGVQLIPRGRGVIKVGDTVTALPRL